MDYFKVSMVENHPLVSAMLSEMIASVCPSVDVQIYDRLSALPSPSKPSSQFVLVSLASCTKTELAQHFMGHTALVNQGILLHSGLLEDGFMKKLGIPLSSYLHPTASVREYYEAIGTQIRKLVQAHTELVSNDEGASGKSGPPSVNSFQSNLGLEGSNKPLTRRQVDIMEHVIQGLSAKEIAKVLKLSPETVRGHIKDIFVRLNVRNIAHAVETYNRIKRFNLISQEYLGSS